MRCACWWYHEAIRAGVPQNTVLSPSMLKFFFFSDYLNNLKLHSTNADEVNERGTWCSNCPKEAREECAKEKTYKNRVPNDRDYFDVWLSLISQARSSHIRKNPATTGTSLASPLGNARHPFFLTDGSKRQRNDSQDLNSWKALARKNRCSRRNKHKIP